jgi:hypothetical protein
MSLERCAIYYPDKKSFLPGYMPTLQEMRLEAKSLGLQGYSSLNKRQLSALLRRRARVFDISSHEDATHNPEKALVQMGLKPRRGDILQILPQEYRENNDGMLIWDGQSAQQLSFEDDEHGAIPRHYQVSDREFNPEYWTDAISRNSFFYPSADIRRRAVKSPKRFMIGKKHYSIDFDEDSKKILHGALQKSLRNAKVPFSVMGEGKLGIAYTGM